MARKMATSKKYVNIFLEFISWPRALSCKIKNKPGKKWMLEIGLKLRNLERLKFRSGLKIMLRSWESSFGVREKQCLLKGTIENLLLGKVTLTNFRSSSKLRLLEIYKSEVLVFFQYPLTGRKNVSFGLSPRVIQKIPWKNHKRYKYIAPDSSFVLSKVAAFRHFPRLGKLDNLRT